MAGLLSQDRVDTGKLSLDFHKEMNWEKTCLEVSQSLDLTDLVITTQKGHEHYQGTYVLEGKMWAWAMPSTRWQHRFPSLRTLCRRLTIDKTSGFYASAKVLEEAHDPLIPFHSRLDKVGDMLQKATAIRDVSRRLLVYFAATRWLLRNNQYHLAKLTLMEYEALSLRLTRGGSRDSIGIARDIYEKPWVNVYVS